MRGGNFEEVSVELLNNFLKKKIAKQFMRDFLWQKQRTRRRRHAVQFLNIE
jgi:hypothetical protein